MNNLNVRQDPIFSDLASEISIHIERISALTDAVIAINQGKELNALKPITLEALLFNISDSAGAVEKAANKIVSAEWEKKNEVD